MEIRFVKSNIPDPYSGEGYLVWTNQYTDRFKLIGFVSIKNLKVMEDYFIELGYDVRRMNDV
jgi:hypothetical protein